MATSAQRLVTEAVLTPALAGKSDTTHTHAELSVAAGYKAKLDSNGIFQLLKPDGSISFRWDLVNGDQEAGSIPWTLLTAIPSRNGYDSGKRQVTTLLNGWTGAVNIQRYGDDIRMSAEGLVSSAATSGVVFNVPAGFRPKNTQRGLLFTLFTSTATIARYSIAPTGDVTITGYSGMGALYGNMPVGLTQDALPGTLPGTAA